MCAKKKKEPVPNRLEEIRLANGENMREAAKRVGLPYTTYISYEKRQREMDSESLIYLSKALGVSIDYLLYRDGNVVPFKPPLVQKYEQLDDTAKRVVDSVIGIELERNIEKADEKQTKIIPLFPAAAGPDSPVDGEAFDEYEVPEDSKAAFAVRISGDSMEPEFHPGDVVLCEKRIANDGEIAVIMVNGCLLVKQYIPDSFGNIYLRSLNRDRKDLDVDILASGNYTVQGWGTVIHKRIPLVEQ